MFAFRLAAATTALLAACPGARGDDFRIATQVFVDKETKPASENLTLFHGGLVYDFMLGEPQEITIFDPANDRIELVAPSKKLRTEISTGSLTAENLKSRQQALKASSELAQFLAQPKFEQSFDASSGDFAFRSDWLSYEIKSQRAPTGQVSSQHREFSDWFARLNSAARRMNSLPFSRVIVNEGLYRRERLPTEVVMKVHDGKSQTKVRRQFRSTHAFSAQLTPEDLERIARAKTQRDQAQPVEIGTYLRAVSDKPDGKQ